MGEPWEQREESGVEKVPPRVLNMAVLLLGLGIQRHSTRWGKGRRFSELSTKGASSQTCIAFIFSITCVSRAIWPISEIKTTAIKFS